MPICINCAQPLESLYLRYGKDHIVLSPCPSPSCPYSSSSSSTPGVADEYLEHSLVLVVLDLILAKPRAYRHLLFNRSSIFASPTAQGRGWGELWKVGKRWVAMSLVDAYIRWFYLCVQPPVSTSLGREGGGRLSSRIAGWVEEWLPMQAGVFFPSAFTPRASTGGWEGEERAVRAVCSAIPIWGWGWEAGGGEGGDEILPTLVSYLNVLAVTVIEGLALHLVVGLLSWVAVRSLSRSRTSLTQQDLPPKATPLIPKPSAGLPHRTTTPLTPSPTAPKPPVQRKSDFNDPLLPSKALLLSQLSPLILLTFVLLWSTKFPHSHKPLSTTTSSGLDRGWMVWVIRTFLASLNAGVALGTVLPLNDLRAGKGGKKRGAWWPPLILALAWTGQATVSWGLYQLLS